MARRYTLDQDRAWHNTLPTKRVSSVLILRDGDHVFMLKDDYKPYWTFPGGVVDPGESPKLAAIRETHEEIGLIVPAKDVEFANVTYVPEQHGFLDRLHFFFISHAKRGAKITPQRGIEAHDWVPIDKVAELAGGRPSYVALQDMLQSGHTHQYSEGEVMKKQRKAK